MAAEIQTVTALPDLKPRDPHMHKGDAGRLFCVAGSVGMVGAAALCSRAALRSGAGLVKVGMPWRLAAVVAGRDPNVMTVALPETADGTISAVAPTKILKAMEEHDVMLIGPGISTAPETVQAVKIMLPQVDARLVIDADALNAIAKDPGEVLPKLNRDNDLPILTPHPGEMRRLLGDEFKEADLGGDHEKRREIACWFAKQWNLCLVLKGHKTVVADPTRVYVNTTGNPGLAKAGSGDVLAGVIAALVGQGYSSFDAAALGTYLHGLAGDLIRDKIGEIGMLATDVIEALPRAAYLHQQNSKESQRVG